MDVPEKTVAPKPSPQAEDVKAFLRDTSSKRKTKTVDLEIDPSELIGEDPGNKKEADTPIDPTFNPDTPTRNSQDPWVFNSPNQEEVEVTPEDKDTFFKAVLNESSVVLDIPVNIGPRPIDVRCRSLNNFEIDVIYAAIDAQPDIKSMSQFMTMLQRYSVMLQVMAFNGKNLKPVVFGRETEEKAVKKLQSSYKRIVQDTDQARWQVLLTALRTFSIKLKVCNDNILNENFWSPADTD